MTSFADVELWTAPDGARLALRREPAQGPRRGSLVFVHGWGDYTGRWAAQARWFAERGIAVFAADQRGHGQTPGRRGHVDRFAQYLADLGALRKLAAADGAGPQLLMGHSYGGFIVLRYLESGPPGVAGAILLTPFVDLVEQPAWWKTTLARLIVDVLPGVPISTGLEYQAISRDPDVVRVFHDDPLCHEVMTPRAYQEMMANLPVLVAERPRIAARLFFALAGDDRIVSTPAAQAFAAALTGDVTVHTYPGMYHNILHEPDHDRVYADLSPWLDGILGAAAAA